MCVPVLAQVEAGPLTRILQPNLPSFLLGKEGKGGHHQPAEFDSPQRRRRLVVSKGLGAGPQIRSLWALSLFLSTPHLLPPRLWGPGPLPRKALWGRRKGGCWPPSPLFGYCRTTLGSMQGAVSDHWFPDPVKFGTISIWRLDALAAMCLEAMQTGERHTQAAAG